MKFKSYVFRAECLNNENELVFSHEIVVRALSYKEAWAEAVNQLACDDVRLELYQIV